MFGSLACSNNLQDVRYNVTVNFIEGVNDDHMTEHHSHLQGNIDHDANSTDGDFNGGRQSEESDAEEVYSKASPKTKARKGRKRTAPKSDNTLESPGTPHAIPAKKKAKTINTGASNGNRYTSTKQAAGVAATNITLKRAGTTKKKGSPKKVPRSGPAVEPETGKGEAVSEPGTKQQGEVEDEPATITTTEVCASEHLGGPANDIASAAAS